MGKHKSRGEKWCANGLWGIKVVEELIPITSLHTESVRITRDNSSVNIQDMLACRFFFGGGKQT